MNVVIYTKNNCSFCTNAKSLLINKGILFKELKLNEDFTREFILELYPNAKTFPIIIIDGMNIGGFSELKEMMQSQPDSRKFLNEGEWNGA